MSVMRPNYVNAHEYFDSQYTPMHVQPEALAIGGDYRLRMLLAKPDAAHDMDAYDWPNVRIFNTLQVPRMFNAEVLSAYASFEMLQPEDQRGQWPWPNPVAGFETEAPAAILPPEERVQNASVAIVRYGLGAAVSADHEGQPHRYGFMLDGVMHPLLLSSPFDEAYFMQSALDQGLSPEDELDAIQRREIDLEKAAAQAHYENWSQKYPIPLVAGIVQRYLAEEDA